MATIALSAAGMALGGSVGGTVLGLSMATIGRAAGAAIGQRIDQSLLGGGSAAVETGRIDRFRITGAAEGADVQRVHGRMRVAGQVIWATQFFEDKSSSGGGKGSRPTPVTTTYSYSVSLAIALCEGVIGRVGRVWADGVEISPEVLNMRVYPGTATQLPDPKIAAVEGAENAPAYRGTAYVVLEDLALGQFGNRIPQLSFEVVRGARQDVWDQVQGVVLGDGCGEYALATTQLHGVADDGAQVALNTHSPLGGSDFPVAIDVMQGDLPVAGSVVLPVAWFGGDLRCAHCGVMPMVSDALITSETMPWRVSGVTSAQAPKLPAGLRGTPADAAVTEALADLRLRGLHVVLQPTLRMVQGPDNGLTDPWGGSEQDAAPWCGRVTASSAPGEAGSPDGTAAVRDEIAAFFGDADAAGFQVSGPDVSYQGGSVGGYRHLVLHYAHLAAAAGGVDAFLIGTDLAGLTCLRDETGAFPAVAALQALAAEVRAILGPSCKIGYAADGQEALGYTPPGTADRLFPLDPLWADPEVDFVGINARMPLSDWRAGDSHRDRAAGAVHDPAYLRGNVAGGEGYDWHYPTPEARAAQRRVPITDPDGEHWVWRSKDYRGWWENPHHPRLGGVRQTQPTAWQPQSKPIWMLSLGCRAVHLGANTPDPAALGRDLPHGSDGRRDDLIQQQYLRAVLDHYAEDNPVSSVYGGRMMATDRTHVRRWDLGTFPFLPVHGGGTDYATGAGLNGRAGSRSLAAVVAEICAACGVSHYDVSGLYGFVRGYLQSGVATGRAGLQPLMLAYGFDAVMRNGVLVFRSRQGSVDAVLDGDWLARDPETDEHLRFTRAPRATLAGRVQVGFIDADADYAPLAREAALPDDATPTLTRSEFPLAMTATEGADCVSRWLQETRAGRDAVQFALPPSRMALGAGDTITIDGGSYRISRIEESGVRLIEAARIAPQGAGGPVAEDGVPPRPVAFTAPVPAEMVFLDLPLITGDEQPHAPHVAVTGNPWPGSIALYSAAQDSGYALEGLYEQQAVLGVTETALPEGQAGLWQRRVLRVAVSGGSLSSATDEAVLAGANTMAIGSGSGAGWEVFQFRTAVPVSGGYLLSGLLRGQSGTWGDMPASWPVGSRVVLLDGVPRQLGLPSAARGTARHLRFGPATAPMTDASYRYQVHRFDGIGLRPYPVVHLRARKGAAGIDLTWIRCTRIDGDIWDGVDVPLGEDTESYLVRVRKAGAIVRETLVTEPSWTYADALIADDIASGEFKVTVAQISARFGAGPDTGLTLTA